MGSGPVIIQDDGGPPFTDELTLKDKAIRVGYGVRIGRAHEFMQELQIANGRHSLTDGSAAIVGVSVNGAPQVTGSTINKVVIVGNGTPPTHITITSGAGPVKVFTDQPLTDESKPGWGRYKASVKDDHVMAVSINGGGNVLNGNETSVKVEIEVD